MDVVVEPFGINMPTSAAVRPLAAVLQRHAQPLQIKYVFIEYLRGLVALPGQSASKQLGTRAKPNIQNQLSAYNCSVRSPNIATHRVHANNNKNISRSIYWYWAGRCRFIVAHWKRQRYEAHENSHSNDCAHTTPPQCSSWQPQRAGCGQRARFDGV